MNRYGKLAWERMRAFQPEVLAGIEDPDSYFSSLGEDLDRQISELAEQIVGPTRRGETYQERLGRLREARITAESEVMRRVGAPMEEEEPATNWPGATGWMPVAGPADPDDPSYRQEQESRGQ